MAFARRQSHRRLRNVSCGRAERLARKNSRTPVRGGCGSEAFLRSFAAVSPGLRKSRGKMAERRGRSGARKACRRACRRAGKRRFHLLSCSRFFAVSSLRSAPERQRSSHARQIRSLHASLCRRVRPARRISRRTHGRYRVVFHRDELRYRLVSRYSAGR